MQKKLEEFQRPIRLKCSQLTVVPICAYFTYYLNVMVFAGFILWKL